MKKEQLKQGFTLVEIMIVVAIIGILAAIAIPNFLKSRKESQKNACIANLKQIQGACEQAKLAGTPVPTATEIYGPANYIKKAPTCPTSKGAYTLATTTDGNPTCATADHVLPEDVTP